MEYEAGKAIAAIHDLLGRIAERKGLKIVQLGLVTAASVIPVLSLVVAALAVFVGPIIQLRIFRRQLTSTLEVSNKQITAPMRQAWINSLRDLLSELISDTMHYYAAGFEERTEDEYRRLTYLEYRTRLMLNPNEEDHQRLEVLIRKMIGGMAGGKNSEQDFFAAHPAVVALSREILKREWSVIKEPVALSKALR